MTPTPTDRAAARRHGWQVADYLDDRRFEEPIASAYLAGILDERQRTTALVRGLVVPEWNHAGTPPAAMRHNVEQVVAAIARGPEEPA